MPTPASGPRIRAASPALSRCTRSVFPAACHPRRGSSPRRATRGPGAGGESEPPPEAPGARVVGLKGGRGGRGPDHGAGRTGSPGGREEPEQLTRWGGLHLSWSPTQKRSAWATTSQSRNMALVTARTAASVREAPVCGVHRALTGFASSPFAEFVRNLIILTEWRASPVKVVNRLPPPGQ